MRHCGESGTTWIIGVMMLMAGGCKRHYNPPAITAPNNYLVVEGVIAAGTDSTIITLNRTVNISQQITANPERGASVTVESDGNNAYPLTEVDTGRYGAAPLNLDASHKYRLHIVTADGRTYESNYEPVKITPPIDTLGYNITNDGLNIYTNAHDPANNTHYYRWDYSETYIYNSPTESLYAFDPTKPDTQMSALRTPAQQIYTCYITRPGSAIILSSSAKLSQDVINNNPIVSVPKTSEKIFHRYSILVKQYALTPEAYQFWSVLQRNSQQIGTIFDVQPSEVQSNIHCSSNPAEPVIGYISVSSISQKRIFIDRSELPAWPIDFPPCPVPGAKPQARCWSEGAPPDPDLVAGNVIPTYIVKKSGCGDPPTPGYAVSVIQYDCVDCRLHLHGKTVKPTFWK